MLFAACCAAGLLGSFAAARRWAGLRAEDGWIETLGAVAFLGAAVCLAVVVLRGWQEERYGFALRQAVVAVLALVLFLSEISFGARFFGWDMPKMKGGGEFDGAHDVAIVAARRWREAGLDGLAAVTAAASVAGGLLLAGLVVFRRQAAAWTRYGLCDLSAFQLAAAGSALAGAVVLDLLPDRHVTAHILEEALEFVAAGITLSFALRMLAAGNRGRPGAGFRLFSEPVRRGAVMDPAE